MEGSEIANASWILSRRRHHHHLRRRTSRTNAETTTSTTTTNYHYHRKATAFVCGLEDPQGFALCDLKNRIQGSLFSLFLF
ncbi:hypothetical protein SLA2020_453010 [Shorea laevis]